MNLYYCFDAYCRWCYGFGHVIQKMQDIFKNELVFNILSGGLIIPERPAHISTLITAFLEDHERIETTSGVKFGEDYLWHIKHPDKSDWYPNSLVPATAICIVRDINPDIAIDFAHDMQYSLFFEGRDLTDKASYSHLLAKYRLPEDIFFEGLHSEKFIKEAYADFDIVRKLHILSYPTVLIQFSVDKFYLLTNGYISEHELESRIRNVISEINN